MWRTEWGGEKELMLLGLPETSWSLSDPRVQFAELEALRTPNQSQLPARLIPELEGLDRRPP